MVRLLEGDFDREIDYGDDPVSQARDFARSGARTLHVVDLDGAREGRPVQLSAVTAIAAAGVARIEVAGGLRSAADVAAAIAAGADRIVVGTRAIADPSFAADLVSRYGAGWRDGAPGIKAEIALRALAEAGVTTFEVTSINRDGRLQGPDLALLGGLVALERGEIIASGGIGSIDDLRAVRDLGCVGAIVGRAIYEGRFDLAEAVAALA